MERDKDVNKDDNCSTFGKGDPSDKDVSGRFEKVEQKTLTHLVCTKLPSKLCADLLTHLRKVRIRSRFLFIKQNLFLLPGSIPLQAHQQGGGASPTHPGPWPSWGGRSTT